MDPNDMPQTPVSPHSTPTLPGADPNPDTGSAPAAFNPAPNPNPQSGLNPNPNPVPAPDPSQALPSLDPTSFAPSVSDEVLSETPPAPSSPPPLSPLQSSAAPGSSPVSPPTASPAPAPAAESATPPPAAPAKKKGKTLILALGLVSLLTAGGVAAYVLVNQQQDTRRQAAAEPEPVLLATPIPVAVPACPLASDRGEYLVDFSGDPLVSNATQLEAELDARPVTIPAGTYQVTLASFDASHPGETSELQESYLLLLLGQEGFSVATTSAIADLATAETTFSQVTDTALVIPEIVQGIVPVHAAHPDATSPNSIIPLCAHFAPVAPAPASTDATPSAAPEVPAAALPQETPLEDDAASGFGAL